MTRWWLTGVCLLAAVRGRPVGDGHAVLAAVLEHARSARGVLHQHVCRVVITGGAGYVGSHTTHLLARTGGYDILVIDNLESGHAEAVPDGVALKVIDTGDAEAVAATLLAFRPHAVIDFAAYLDVGHSQEQPQAYVRNNVQNFKNVLDAMVASGCNLIIKSSTQATYGDAPQSAMPLSEAYNAEGASHFASSNLAEGHWNGTALSGQQLFDRFLEAYGALSADAPWLALTPSERSMLYTPRSIYGLSKLLDEVMMRKYAARHRRMRWVSLRYGNVCGAALSGTVGEAKRRPHTLMTLAIYSLLGRHKPVLSLYGRNYHTPDGTAVRDYVHPTDLAVAHVSALRYLLAGNASDVFNLGTGRGYSVFEVLRAVEAASGRQVRYEIGPRRVGDCALSVLDVAKARATLGYRPTLGLDDMARSAWRWHAQLHEAFVRTLDDTDEPAAVPHAELASMLPAGNASASRLSNSVQEAEKPLKAPTPGRRRPFEEAAPSPSRRRAAPARHVEH